MEYTQGPWAWQDIGGDRLLLAQHGKREVIIGARLNGFRIPSPAMNRNGVLLGIDPNHPNARIIAAAPALYAALQEIVLMSDRLINAKEAIEIMKDLALAALKKAEGSV